MSHKNDTSKTQMFHPFPHSEMQLKWCKSYFDNIFKVPIMSNILPMKHLLPVVSEYLINSSLIRYFLTLKKNLQKLVTISILDNICTEMCNWVRSNSDLPAPFVPEPWYIICFARPTEVTALGVRYLLAKSEVCYGNRSAGSGQSGVPDTGCRRQIWPAEQPQKTALGTDLPTPARLVFLSPSCCG